MANDLLRGLGLIVRSLLKLVTFPVRVLFGRRKARKEEERWAKKLAKKDAKR